MTGGVSARECRTLTSCPERSSRWTEDDLRGVCKKDEGDVTLRFARTTGRVPMKGREVTVRVCRVLGKRTYCCVSLSATDGPRAIARAIGNLLALADSEGLATLAMPALGTGTGHLPSREFGRLLHEVSRSRVDHHPSGPVRGLAVAAWTRNALFELVKGWEASGPGV